MYNTVEPARTTEVASNVVIIEELPMNKRMPENLASLCQDLIIYETYSLLGASVYVEGMSKWQR